MTGSWALTEPMCVETKLGWSVASVILFAANDSVELGSTLPTEVLWVAPASNAWRCPPHGASWHQGTHWASLLLSFSIIARCSVSTFTNESYCLEYLQRIAQPCEVSIAASQMHGSAAATSWSGGTHLSRIAFFSLIAARISCFRRFLFSVSVSTSFRLPIAYTTHAHMQPRQLACPQWHRQAVCGRRTLSLASSIKLACLDNSSTSDRTVPLNSLIPAARRRA